MSHAKSFRTRLKIYRIAQPGERPAVVGIGGLGHLAVQYAKAAGFTTIAISHSADKINSFANLAPTRLCVTAKVWPQSAART